jgi:DNA-binding beta-propeller fold protein YncE
MLGKTSKDITARPATAGRIFSIVLCAAALSSCASTGPAETGADDAQPPELVYPPPPETARFVFERTISSSGDISPEDSESKWRRILTGESRELTAFSKPFDVTACEGRIYVSDTVRRSVLVFDVPNGEFNEIGIVEPGELRKPLGMAVDADCNLYVVDATLKRIVVYDQDGEFVTAFGGMDMFERPSHVDVDAEGRLAYVVDTGGVSTDLHRVRVFEVASGQHLFDMGVRGKGPGQFNLPRDIAVAPDGRLYVVDGANFRVQVFEADGTFVNEFGSVGSYPGNFSRPKGIDSDADGNIYVSDAAFGNFQIFDSEGNLLLFIGDRSNTPGPARYMLPAGIAVDEDGRVYLVDQFYRKIDVFRPAQLGPGDGFLGARAAVQ